MNIRVLHKDGIDELYKRVVKFLCVGEVYMVYTEVSTFTIPLEDVGFMQIWESGE
jgi:hypothetical protein